MKKPKVLLVHPGTQHSKYLAIELFKRKLLYKYFTGLAIPTKSAVVKTLLSILPPLVTKHFQNRLVHSLRWKDIRVSPWVELSTIKKLKDLNINKEEVFFSRNEYFQKNIAEKYINRADIIVGFDTSSWVIAGRAKRNKKKFILDQTTAEPIGKAEILKRVATEFPMWKFDLQTRFEKYNQTDNIEYRLADKIVVASSYTKETLIDKEIDEKKIVVIPYGTDLEQFYPNKTADNNGVLKFLFVGAVSALKGVPLLLQAWEKIDHTKAELVIVGAMNDEVKKLVGERPGVKLLGAFPKDQLPEVYRSCHVFVFPSYSEGFGQVILEALATGLPVITTTNTGGKDLIQDGEEGFVIPAGSSEQLLNAMNFFINESHQMQKMAIKARTKALTYSWTEYGKKWEQIINEVALKN